jgi:hypothetical protein
MDTSSSMKDQDGETVTKAFDKPEVRGQIESEFREQFE